MKDEQCIEGRSSNQSNLICNRTRPARLNAIAITTTYLGRLTAQLTSRPERSAHFVKTNPHRLNSSCFTTLAGSNPTSKAKSEVLKSHPRSDARSRNSNRSLVVLHYFPACTESPEKSVL